MGVKFNSHSGGRRGKYSRSYGVMSNINVTPFVDVMLVLLIVFMITAPLLTSGVSVDLPDSKAGHIQEEDKKPLEITITKDNKMHIGDTEVKRTKLLSTLEAMTEKDRERRIYVRADKTLPYGDVVKVIGDISSAGFTKVALISESESIRQKK